jgi:hypothetical protein
LISLQLSIASHKERYRRGLDRMIVGFPTI